MTNASDWTGKVGETWALEWQRTDRTLGQLNSHLITQAQQMLAGCAQPQVLDIGCGAGTTSISLASACPDAHITGIDISPDLVSLAQQRTVSNPRLVFHLADASTWSAPQKFDLLISRHGVMFFDRPIEAFQHIHGVVRTGGMLLFSCFRSVGENLWAAEVAPIIERVLNHPLPPQVPHAPGPFGFADETHVGNILGTAGFGKMHADKVDFEYVAGAGADPVADAVAFFSRIGPFASVLRSLAPQQKPKLLTELSAFAANHLIGDTVRFTAAAWIWSAEAS